jgi:hypothetical protein
VIDTHGQPWYDNIKLLTSDEVGAHLPAQDPKWLTAQGQGLTSGSTPGSKTLYWAITVDFVRNSGSFERTVVFNGACFGARNSSLADVMAANGGAYFGFTDEASAPNNAGLPIPGYATTIEPILLRHLLGDYMNVSDSYGQQDVSKTDPSLLAILSNALNLHLGNVNARFVLLNDPSNKLAYLGNPTVTGSPGSSPFSTQAPDSVSLRAQLEGAVGCDGTMNYVWKCSTNDGHLISSNRTDRDSYTNTFPTAQYVPNTNAPGGTDSLTVDFLPDGTTSIPAQACAMFNVKSPYFAVIGNEMGVPITVTGSPAANGHWMLQLQTQSGAKDGSGAPEMGMFQVEFDSVPATGFYSPSSNTHVVSASASATYQGRQYGMSCPPFTPNPPNMCNFSIRLTNMSDPAAPQGQATTSVFGPDNFNASLNFFFTPN